MAESVDLNSRGLRLFAARFYNHDYLWFSSVEISKTAATYPVIHNYALSYAVSAYSHGVYFGHGPQYKEDLDAMSAYATPARTEEGGTRTRFTQNAVNSRSLRTDDAPRGSNSPALGWRLVLDPDWETGGRNGAASGFAFYLFAQDTFRPPAVVRLGKKGCPIRLTWDEITPAFATYSTVPVRPSHAVNPLDIQGELVSFEPVVIPPHLILRVAEIRNDWFVFSAGHRVHVPRRVSAG